VNTFARFRLFSATDTSPAATSLLPTGPAVGGEVEDVLVQVGSYDVGKTANPAEGSTIDPGATVTYTLTINNTGSTALANLKIDDDLTDVLDDATVQGTPSVNPSSAGTASISGNTLEFVGDVGIGGTVAVTYTVKVKDGGTLGNAALNNYILATHSTSCSPTVTNGAAAVSDPDCQTNHAVNGLAATGMNSMVPLGLSASLIAGGVGYLVAKRRKVYSRK
jgi:fimbrial isopeptide formation D2 family protein/LPXTG-motif cell wall-anchored protein